MGSLQLVIEHGDPLSADADGFIYPSTATGDRLNESHGNRLGPSWRNKLMEQLPVRIGEAVETRAANGSFDTVVYAPVQTAADTPTTRQNIQSGFRAALVTVDTEENESVVLPCVVPQPSIQNVRLEEIAPVVLRDLLQYPPVHLETVKLRDSNRTWIEALTSCRRQVEKTFRA